MASVACVAELGLEVQSAEVIAAGYSVRVLLRPAQVVTRVVTEGQVLRGDPVPWLRREVEVASFLERAGAAVVPPYSAAGPHRAAGLEITLWRWLAASGGTVGQREFATMLYELHEHLLDYPAELPLLVGPLSDVSSALRISDDDVLHSVAAKVLAEVREWPRRPLHGDAHSDNLLGTAQGYRWLDFEDACVGPVEWDLAARTTSDEAVGAYPGRVDRDLLRACRQLRRLQILAAVLTSDADPDAEARRIELRKALST